MNDPADLKARIAVLEVKDAARDEAIKEMQHDVKELLALANKSRGAFWLGMGIAGSLGGLLGWVTHHVPWVR